MLPGKEIIAALLIWASQLTGLPAPSDLQQPTVGYASELAKSDWAASTDSLNGQIRISSRWHPEPLELQCTLVHELTHYLQWANRRPLSEPEAYAAGARCGEAYGNSTFADWSWKRSRFCTSHSC